MPGVPSFFTSSNPNGPAWAAVLAASLGTAVFGGLTMGSELSPAFSRWMVWYTPSGALSGVGVSSIFFWGLFWLLLHLRWRAKQILQQKLLLTASVLLVITALVLTFPPFYEWL